MTRWILLLTYLTINLCRADDNIDSLQRVLDTSQLNPEQRVSTLCEIGFAYAITDPQKGIAYELEALEEARRLNLMFDEAKALAYLGYLYRITGDYDKSIKYSFDVLELTERVEERKSRDFAFTTLGMVYEQLGRYEKAIEYHRRALAYERGDRNRAHNINNLSNVFYKMNLLDSTIKYDKMAIEIRESINDLPGMAESYNNIGEVYRTLEQYDTAIYYYKKSLDISYELDDQGSIAMSTMNYGAAQVSLGQYEEASEKLLMAYELAKKTNFKEWEVESLTYLKELAYKTGDYAGALAYQEEYTIQKDSLFNMQKEREIRMMESSYERLQREKQMELLRAENRLSTTTRNFLIAGFFVLAGVFWLIINRQRLKARKQKELYETKQELAAAREEKLRKELEYHSKSLSNHTLSMIQKNGMMEELKTEAKMLRDSLDDVHVKKLNSMNRLIDHAINVDDDWKQFEMYFENVHNDFFKKLKEKYGGLTPSDMRLCALVKLNLNIKESATILGISPDSVKIARYRLRKKLNLANEDSLEDAMLL